jgi:hypothetical protein
LSFWYSLFFEAFISLLLGISGEGFFAHGSAAALDLRQSCQSRFFACLREQVVPALSPRK